MLFAESGEDHSMDLNPCATPKSSVSTPCLAHRARLNSCQATTHVFCSPLTRFSRADVNFALNLGHARTFLKVVTLWVEPCLMWLSVFGVLVQITHDSVQAVLSHDAISEA